MQSWRLQFVLMALLFFACSDIETITTSDRGAPVDASVTDGVVGDSSAADADLTDSELDEGRSDSGAQDDSTVDASSEDDAAVSADAGPVDCDPQLQIQSSASAARPFDLVRLRPSGGTGAWRFAFAQNASGGLLNATTGTYLAGEEVGTVDQIHLTDDGCDGVAQIDIRVVDAMTVRPSGGEVEPEQSFDFRVEGGSGEFTFELVASQSDGAITEAGRYRAGANLGEDIVRVTDRQTNQVNVVRLSVVGAISLNPKPAHLFLPLGQTAELVVSGGTGEFVVDVQPGLSFSNAEFTGEVAGRYEVLITDAFTQHETSMRVEVTPSLTAAIEPFGDGQNSTRLLNPGDLNGDGLDDLIVAMSQADVEHGNSGGVFIFHAGPDGFGEPVQTLSGTSVSEEFGRSVSAADLNGDDRIDLVVGARLADPGVGDAGAVSVFYGLEDGRFPARPQKVLPGVRGSDHFGYSLAVCDFNGDGRLDIAGGALLYEDRERNPIISAEGGAFIFLGYEDGFLNEPDQVVTAGMLNADGGWLPFRDLQLGSELQAADVDGDGLCELFIGAPRYRMPPVNNAGAVFVHRGRPGDELGPGGVSSLPVRVIVGDNTLDNGGAFSRRMATGDLNADGLGDLVVGEHAGDTGGRDRGAAYVFLGGDLPDVPADSTTSAALADRIYIGDSNGDNDGVGVAIGDATGDGLPDVLVGAWLDDRPGLSNTGAINVYAGQAGAPPTVEPVREISGEVANMRLGEAVTVVGDLDGDGTPEVIAHATQDSSEYPLVGRTWVIGQRPGEMPPEDDENPIEPELVEVFTPLQIPQVAATGRFGEGVALVGDVTGDGHDDLVATAPFTTASGVRSGGAWLFPGGDGYPMGPGVPVHGFPEHSTSDLVWRATAIGDFDGDGHGDYAVLLRDDERPSNGGFQNAPWRINNPNDCVPRSFGSGGVYIFRGGDDGEIWRRPSFAFWLDRGSLSPEAIRGQLDFNGDGLMDLVVGVHRYDPPDRNNAGAGLVITGRPWSVEGNDIEVICDAYARFDGAFGGGEAGRSVAPMGDINGDGCDDYAIGARSEDASGLSDQGSVRIIYGFGADGCPPSARVHRLVTGERSSQAGWSLDAGDFDGDGLYDLAVGAWQRRTENVPTGGVWVVPGSYLNSLPPKTPEVAAQDEPTRLNSLGPQWLIEGTERDGQTGYAVAMSGSFLAVGSPQDAHQGMARSGMLRIYRLTADGVEPDPVAILPGESARPQGQMGRSISGGTYAGAPAFLVGSPIGNATGLDNGSAYLVRLDELVDER